MRTLSIIFGVVRSLLIAAQLAFAPTAVLAQIGPGPLLSPLPISATPKIGTPVNIGTLNTGTSATTTYTITTTGAVVAGDALVFSAVNYKAGGAANIQSVSDGTNSYTLANRQVFGNQTTEQWYFCGAASVGSGATVTVTFAGGATTLGAVASVTRVPGLRTTSCLDKAPAGVTATSSGNSVSTGTLSYFNEIVFSTTGINNCPTYTEASGFASSNASTRCNSPSGTTMDQSYQTVSTTTGVTSSPSWSSSQINGLLILSLEGY